MDRRVLIGQATLAAVGAAAVLIATRDDPVLSADSITYLSAAENLRDVDGYRDFTGQQLAHFPPVFPALLAIGGRSLTWAALVGAAAAAVTAALLVGVLAARVRWPAAVAGGLLYVLAQAAIRTEQTVWSEGPYVALSLAMIYVLRREGVTTRRAAGAGLLAGLGFLTRYAGAGLVVTGLVMVVVASRADRRRAVRCGGAYLGVSGSLATIWMARNLAATGDPLGPHFRGGAGESLDTLVDHLVVALGRLVIDLDDVGPMTEPAGAVALVGLLGAVMAVALQRRWNVLDAGMATYALTSIVLPLASRALTGTHIEARILFPTLIALIYFVVVAADGRLGHRAVRAGATVVAIAWMFAGMLAAWNGPDRLIGSAANPQQFSPALYERVDALPDDAAVVTNNPWRVWWHTERDRVEFAFTRPTPGNSHFPLSPGELTRRACDRPTYLAWFPGLLNANGGTPFEIRPDLLAVVELATVEAVDGGELFRVTPRTPVACPPPG